MDPLQRNMISEACGPSRRYDDTPNVGLREIIHRSFCLSGAGHHDKTPTPRGIVDRCKDDGMGHGAEIRKDSR